MRIAADGTWFYLKTPIGRACSGAGCLRPSSSGKGTSTSSLPRSRICGIVVDDAPFLAVELSIRKDEDGQTLYFRTNVDDWVACGADHALRFEPQSGSGGLKPYLHVRRNLWARVTRALFYDLVELGEERDVDGERMFGLVSAGEFFAMARAESLKESCLMDVALPSGTTVSSRDFFTRARTRLSLDIPSALDDMRPKAQRGDLDLDPFLGSAPASQATRPAAVLVPVVERPQPQVLLTLRTELPSHPGQVAFPGGKIDALRLKRPAEAALREAAGGDQALPRELVEPIGYLDLYLTFSGYRILPMVARVKADYQLVLCEAEVRDAFEVPLAFLMDAQITRSAAANGRG